MIHVRSFGELDPADLYRILRLRSEVFVVEQACVFNDLDGLDAGAVHLWIDGTDEMVAAAARIIPGDPAYELGRVVTAPHRRGERLAGSIIDAAIDLVPPGCAVVLNAQARLERWYGGWGFRRTGPDFLIDELPHVPMRRPG